MRSRIVRALATATAATLLAGGAAMASTATAFATPTTSAHVAASQYAPTAKCHNVKGHYKTIHSHGKTKKVWVKPHKVCTKK
ncbi:hypothetical protein [Streptomyces lydicus]|uniref:hypothetical protein n=1 Tax=Streptomyces lydicus TaxID=47763 RepID=UPI003787D775